MRILISFLLLMTSFVIAQECSISLCESSTGFSCKQRDDDIYSLASFDYDSANSEVNKIYFDKYGESPACHKLDSGYYTANGYFEQGQCRSTPIWGGALKSVSISSRPYTNNKETFFCSIDKPTLPEPKKCNETYCSGADKKRYEAATWYETGTGCGSQNVKFKAISGGYEMSIDFTCENPKKSSGPICIRYHDEPVDCEETNSEDEAPSLPEDIDIPEIDKVPCFGNVEGCNSTTLPDYIDPNTGVPCWGKECNNVKPPDSVGPDGTPCWGDKCGISPPKDKDGNNGGNDNGSGNGNGEGSGTGNGTGNGNGTGEGEGDGKEEGWGDCPAGGCPDNSALINGQGFAKIPDTFHETKYRDKAIEEALDTFRKDSPIDFDSIDTDLGVRGSCPMEWSIPFHTTSIDIKIPCSVFDQLRGFFIFLSYVFGFYHVFRKRA